MSTVDVLLASGSATRAKLLSDAGVHFGVDVPAVDEERLRAGLSAAVPEAVAMALAEAKAVSVSARNPDALVIGADQVLAFDDAILGKCADRAAARALLRRMAGKVHTLSTATVLARGGGIVWRHADSAHLTMRAFDDAFLDAYLEAEGDAILYCVGCYRLEGRGLQLFEAIAGEYFTILGLNMLALLKALRGNGGMR